MAASTLPMDILVQELLPRLPVKSLLRFKCVSKFFQTLISTPEFAQRHLRHSLASDDNRLLILVRELLGVYSFHLDSPRFHSVSFFFPPEISNVFGHFFIVGSCNGLVCIGTSPSSLLIFNPSTAVYKQVYCDNCSVVNSCVNYGFGFDDINDDYKIVRVKAYMSNVDYFVGMRRDIEVYSLNSDSWSLVERKYDQDPIKHSENGTLVNNHLLHWMFWNPSNEKYRIGCFNLRSNLWADDVPLLDYSSEIDSNVHSVDALFQTYGNNLNDLVKLGVFDGCLCLLTENSQDIGVDVWVMKEYGIRDSWLRLMSIQDTGFRQPFKICPFAYRKGSKSEVLVRMHPQSAFYWFNITDKKWRSAEMHLASAYPEACMCKESLVSIPGGGHFQVQVLGSCQQERA